MNLQVVFLAVLAVVSAVYLVLIFLDRKLPSSILKCCLVPLILAVYIFGAEKILLPVVLALVFGWLGDVFLLKISDLRCFRIGLVSFLTGHIFYIIAMSNYIQPVKIPVLAAGIVVAAVLGFLLFKLVRPNNEMKIPVIIYEAVIFTMAIFAFQVFIAHVSSFGALVFAGSVCFVASDSTLAFDTFRKKTKIGYLIVMITYIAAQLLIALGFSMLRI